MSHAFRRLLALGLLLATTPAATAEPPDPVHLIETHLDRLETKIDELAVGDAEPSEVAALRRHLQALETTILRSAPAGTETFVADVRRLERRLERLGRDAAPEAALPREAVKVQANDDCARATSIGFGSFTGHTSDATNDGSSSCTGTSPDVWFKLRVEEAMIVVADTLGSDYDAALSVHTGCPGTSANEITCNDDVAGVQSEVRFAAQPEVDYLIRVGGCCESSGRFRLNVGPAGTISGRVTDAVSSRPLGGILVTAGRPSVFDRQSVRTNARGEYTFTGLASDSWSVFVDDPPDHLPEIYDGRPCERFGCDLANGTPIVLGAGEAATGIDFTLDRGGVVAGRLSEALTGEPVPFERVELWDERGEQAESVTSDTAGRFRLERLYAGTYFARVVSGSYQGELWDDLPCLQESCDPTDGTPIAVRFGETTRGVDFALERLGRITGTITDALTGFPAAFIDLRVYDPSGGRVAFGQTDPTGTYVVGGLPGGTYFVVTNSFTDYLDELFDDLPCEPSCDSTAGTPVEVRLNEMTPGIDFRLDHLGRISGTVNHAVSGQPIEEAVVDVYDAAGFFVAEGRTNSFGAYTVEGLRPGTVYAVARTFSYRDELWDGLPCGDVCDPTDGTPIEVRLNTVTPGIDFRLDRLGRIRGTITHTLSGQPIEGVEVNVHDAFGNPFNRFYTDSAGRYTVEALPPGEYVVMTSSGLYFDELWDDIPCEAQSCDLGAGAKVAVDLNATAPGIDFRLDRLGEITGTVTHTLSGQPISNAGITVQGDTGSIFTSTDDTGFFRVQGLVPGLWTVFAEHRDYLDELYRDRPCEGGCDPSTGTPVRTRLNATTADVDFELERLGSIAGRALVAATGQPATNFNVRVYDRTGNLVGQEFGFDGTYEVRGLLPGVHYAVAEDFDLPAVLYDGLPCATGCDPRSGTPIVASLNTVTDGVDFFLGAAGPCVPSNTALCANGDRFRVEVSWQDTRGNTGPGFAVPLTSDSGYFWFFDPQNVELVVKVLDGCFPPFDHFWVFAGGLTNVRTELVVTDELTGDVKTWVNPQGTAFQPIRDVEAFATCDASTAAETLRRDALDELERYLADPPTLWLPPAPDAKVGSCVPDATRLCLNGGRFAVETSWRTNRGETGSGGAVQITADTGYFWFFNPENVEVMVKLLDACDLAPFHSFWTFAAGLTDVEVRLRVTDTISGEVREYLNPLDTGFLPIQDTEAFRTCP